MKLNELQSGQNGRILKISAKEKLYQKLLDMGFINGAIITVVREAPLYDPMELKIHNYLVSLRKSEANLIQVELI